MNKLLAGLIMLIIAFAVYEQVNFSFASENDLRAVSQANEALHQALVQKQLQSQHYFEYIKNIAVSYDYRSLDIAFQEEAEALFPISREVIAEVKNLHWAISREDGQYTSKAHTLVGAWERYRPQLNRYTADDGYTTEGKEWVTRSWYELAGADTEVKGYRAFEQPVALLRKGDSYKPVWLQTAALYLGWKIAELENKTMEMKRQHAGHTPCVFDGIGHAAASSVIVEEGTEYRAELFAGLPLREVTQVKIGGKEIENVGQPGWIVIPATATDFDQHGRATKSFEVWINGSDSIVKIQRSFIVRNKAFMKEKIRQRE